MLKEKRIKKKKTGKAKKTELDKDQNQNTNHLRKRLDMHCFVLSPTHPTVSNPGTSAGSPRNTKNLTKLTGNTGTPGTLCYQGGGGGTKF